MKTAEIKLTIQLDDDNVPENITWESTDAQNKEALPVKSMMLALWDQNYKNTLRIDLWTKEMPVDEMKQFFYETLQTMGDSFLRATGETNIVEDLRDYCLRKSAVTESLPFGNDTLVFKVGGVI